MSHPSDNSAELQQARQLNDELRAQNATKDEFIALASHQLRTPATAVKQYLGMVLEGYIGELTPEQKEFIQKAYDNNERQISTINDLLQVAQIDADKIVLHRETCDIIRLLHAVADEFRGITKNRQQQIILRTSQSPLWVDADPLRLRMALDNIVDNASKYSNEHTTITLHARVERSNIRIDITDEGVGIAKKDFARLFQKFSRIDNPRSIMVGGNGLGLYLAQRVVRAHDGELTVRSTLAKGTTFTVHLPKITQP